jgi:hypothetical protein
MKHIYLILLSILIAGLIIFSFKSCEQTPIDNSRFDTIDSLNKELAILKAFNDTLELKYSNRLNEQQEVRELVKTKYITIHDTLRCLPEIYVDSIFIVQDSVNAAANELLTVKDSMIDNLEQSGALKDTIIIEQKQEIKRQKRGKLKAFIGGVGVGALVRSLF